MRNNTKLFLISVTVFAVGFLLVGNAKASTCWSGTCKVTCATNEERSTQPGDGCPDAYDSCCVPKADGTTPITDPNYCAGAVAGAPCTDSSGRSGTCSSGVCRATIESGSTCASSPDGTICQMTDGKEGACKNNVCASTPYYDQCAGALATGASCKTSSGASGSCKNNVCTTTSGGFDFGSNSSDTTAAGSGWNSSDLGSFGLPDAGGSGDVREVIVAVLDWLLTIIGILAIIAFVIAGIQYYLVATDEKMLETAKKTMRAAIIGIVVALSGFIFIKAVDAMLRAGYLF